MLLEVFGILQVGAKWCSTAGDGGGSVEPCSNAIGLEPNYRKLGLNRSFSKMVASVINLKQATLNPTPRVGSLRLKLR